MNIISPFFILLYFFRKKKITNTYYKMIIYDHRFACLEGNISEKIANQFNATKGICKHQNCLDFQGSRYVPFVGTVDGYICN